MLCGHPHRRQHRHGVHLDAANPVGHGMLVVAGVEIRHREPVVKKAEIEFTRLQNPPDVLKIFGRGRIRTRLRVAPGGGNGRAVLSLQERYQSHLSHGVDFLCAIIVKPSNKPSSRSCLADDVIRILKASLIDVRAANNPGSDSLCTTCT